MKLDTLENEIEGILAENEKARGDDMALYFMYLCKRNVGLLRTFTDATYRKMNDISTFESVSRCRRKLQEKYPELKPNAVKVGKRKEREKDFVEYARGHKC